MNISDLFTQNIVREENLIIINTHSNKKNQSQTNDAFSDKWKYVKSEKNTRQLASFQKKWFLDLYGYCDENDFAKALRKNKYILDAGCGLGYKSAWFAELAPESIVIGMDFSESVKIAATKYEKLNNLFFVQGDIATTYLKCNIMDLIVCDQVIMHTEHPSKTFSHLSELLTNGGQFCCYVYREKALPRELLDTYFRNETHNISKKELWEMSEQLTILGETLSNLDIQVTVPDIPLLGIKGGDYDLQRFIYWNFIKCFWNEDWSKKLNISTNFDWYSPSNAKRYSEEEFKTMVSENNLSIEYFHKEEACFSGRFSKP